MKKTALSLTTMLILFVVATRIYACGGFFSQTIPVDQNAERIIFSVNGDGTVTAIVGINYVGEAEEFSWVVPVPSPPEVGVTETGLIDAFQFATDVQVNNIIPQTCYELHLMPCCFGGGGEPGGPVVNSGQVGPYDFAVLSSDNPDEILNWLRDNNYRVTDDMLPLLDVYVEEGMYFLAMKLQQDSAVDDIQPVVMTYEADKPTIPLRLTAVAAVENMPVVVWILGEHRYVPENYEHLTNIDVMNRVRLNNQVFYMAQIEAVNRMPLSEHYLEQYFLLQDEYDGKVFITEFAGPVDDFYAGVREKLPEDSLIPVLSDFMEQYPQPYVTRLRAQLSPDQMTVDPSFVPASDDTPISNFIEPAQVVDPLEFLGCTSRSAAAEIDKESVPPARTRFDEWNMFVANPMDWIQSEVTLERDFSQYVDITRIFRDDLETLFGEEPVQFLAPIPVTQEVIDAYFAGESLPPMMLFAHTNWYINQSYGEVAAADAFHILFNQPLSETGPIDELPYVDTWYPPERVYEEIEGVFMAILTSPNDWQANEAMYQAILDYPHTYQYFSSPDYGHTLFLRPAMNFDEVNAIPFPLDWVEETLDDGSFAIHPDIDMPLEAMPYVRVKTYDVFDQAYIDEVGEGTEYYPDDIWQDMIEWAVDEYGIEPPDNTLTDICTTESPLLFEYDGDGHSGMVYLNHSFIVEVSGPDGVDTILSDIMDITIENMEEIPASRYFCAE